jgi:hypothetical protein
MAVDHERLEAKSSELLRVFVDVMPVHGLLSLSEGVHIEEEGQVTEFVVAGERGGLPDGSLGALPVPDDAVHPVLYFV